MENAVVSKWVFDLGIWPLLLSLLPYLLIFRRHGKEAIRKQTASLLHTVAIFLISTAAGLISLVDASDLFLLLAVAVVGTLLYIFRSRTFPYRLTCPECGHRHNLLSAEIQNTYVMDDDLCEECRERLNPSADDVEEDADEEAEDEDGETWPELDEDED